MTSKKSVYVMVGTSVVTAIVLIIGILVGSLFVAPAMNSRAAASPLPQVAAANNVLMTSNAAADDIVAAFESVLETVHNQAMPSVVNISVTKAIDTSGLGFDFGNQLPKNHPDFLNQGTGSGFVWDKEGHIVTNNHVVEGATNIEVLFADDTRAPAQLVGTDPDSDLAVIKVNLPASYLQPLRLGDSDKVRVGQLVMALGSPFGQEFTMTSGIVSAAGRLIRGGHAGFSIPEAIQTDAAINPGNSGGPLLNRNGEVVGINAQILTESGGSSGIGFAIPINIAQKVVPTLISGDTYQYSWLGISGGEVTADMATFRGLDSQVHGAVVADVLKGGPADKAGLKGRDTTANESSDEFRFSGDIITAINGTPMNGIDDLITYLVAETKPGDKVTMDVIHTDGSKAQVTVTLGQRPTDMNQ
jgi:2-alkenal reductase